MLIIILYAVLGGLVGAVILLLSDILVQSRASSKINLPWIKRFSRPVCPNCEYKFSIREYLFSFRCKNCNNRPPLRYFIVIILSIISSLMVSQFPLGGLSYWATIPLMIFLGIVLVIDIKYHAVLIETSVIGIVLFFFYGFLMQGFSISIVGGVAGGIIMFLIYLFGILFSKITTKAQKNTSPEPGMGWGDVYVGIFLGFFTGWPWIFGAIILAILLSGVFSFFYLLYKSVTKTYQFAAAIPYSPFLIIGAIAVFYLPAL